MPSQPRRSYQGKTNFFTTIKLLTHRLGHVSVFMHEEVLEKEEEWTRKAETNGGQAYVPQDLYSPGAMFPRTYATIKCSCSFRLPWPWCKVIVGRQRQKSKRWIISATIKQATSIKLATKVGPVLRDLDIENIYMAWLSCISFEIYMLDSNIKLNCIVQFLTIKS